MHAQPSAQRASPAALDTARAQLAGFLSTPLIAAQARPWRPEDEQADLLNEREKKALPRRFSGEPITGFGELA